MNLLNNAIKFSPDSRTIMVSCYRNNKDIRVEVEDTGIGISRENVRKLFNTDNLTTTETLGETGTGFGLLLCRDFVSKNGGGI